MKRLLYFTVSLFVTLGSFAQTESSKLEKAETQAKKESTENPKEQPLDKPTEVKELLKQPPVEPKTVASFGGSLPTGQNPTASPEHNFVNRLQDIPVNSFIGAAIIGLPIYTLTEAGGATVPIMLSYNSTGMKAHELSGWCGMNFSISMYQITRIVRGIPDEGKFGLIDNSYNSSPRKGFFNYGRHADNDDENDTQSDIYFLNINGTSYKFTFDDNRKAHFFPEADIDVQVSWTPLSGSTIVGKFSNWIVTMPDGMKYHFSGNFTESSIEVEAQDAYDNVYPGSSDFTKFSKAESVISGWYLTDIETAFDHHTLFSYNHNNYSFFRVADQEAVTNNCTFTGISKKINRVFINSSTLVSIQNKTKKVEFNKDLFTYYINSEGDTVWVSSSPASNRLDIDNYSRVPSSSSNAKRLETITVTAFDDPNQKLVWSFGYDYNNGYDILGIPFAGYTYTVTGYTHQKRFKLRTITEPDGNQYKFSYYDDSFPLPSRFTMGVDHWGLLNGAINSLNLIGEDAFRTCTSGQYANRSATVGWSQYGTISSISHSTGGKTTIEYENNYARNYNLPIGGSRVSRITFEDMISKLKTVKIYQYVQANGASSGFLCLKPVYHFDSRYNLTGLQNQYWHSGLYQQTIAESGRPAVGYSRVKETILSGNSLDTLGFNISEFNQPLTEINITDVVLSNCHYEFPPSSPPVYVCDTNRYIRPYRWNPYHENNAGVPFRVSVYSKTGVLLSQNSNAYQEEIVPIPQTNFRSFRMVGENYNFANSYSEYYTTFRLKSDTSKTFSQTGTNPVITKNKYDYKGDMPQSYQNLYKGKHNQLCRTTTTDSYGFTIINLQKYAADFDFGQDSTLVCTQYDENGNCLNYGYQYSPHIPTNAEALGIFRLQQKHILNGAIESSTQKTGVGGANFYLSATYQTYYENNGTGVKMGMPKASFEAENMPRTTFNEVVYNRTTAGETYETDENYDFKASVLAYTNEGLPKQTQVKYGPIQSTTYDTTYPSLPIGETTNVGQYSEQSTAMEYQKILFGVSKQIGTNGLEVRSSYYPDGKLQQQTDKDGNVLKNVQYAYRGQEDSDPLLNTDTTYNRIITRMPRVATSDALSLDHTQCTISIAYIDGAGRSFGNVAYRASPNQKDLVSGLIDYDVHNRPLKQWLMVQSPYSDGRLLDTATYKTIARTFYKDQAPYTEVAQYETAPTSRVLKSYGAGKAWRDNNKFVQTDYETGTGIKKFTLAYNSNTASIDTYNSYELSKITSTDERGSIMQEYKDKAGNIILTRTQLNDTEWATVYHIFDDAGRLRYSLPPKAYNALGSLTTLDIESWAEFNENVYAFHQDGRGRVYEKHIPGKGWERFVFNRLNLALLFQNDDEASRNIWNYTKFDGHGRNVQKGQFVSTLSRATLQGLFDVFIDNTQFEERSTASGNVLQYTNRSFPPALQSLVTVGSLKAVNYFDDYGWRYNDATSGTIADYDFKANPFNPSAYSAGANHAKGLATGGLIQMEMFGSFWFPEVAYFDDKNRGIQHINFQNLLARNQTDVQYNFVGETVKTRNLYRKQGATAGYSLIEQPRDHVGRVKEIYYTNTLAGQPRFKMMEMRHDDIGRPLKKLIKPNTNGNASVQTGNWTALSTWLNFYPSITTPVVINQGHTITIPENETVQAGSIMDKGTLTFQTGSVLELGTAMVIQSAALQVIDYSYDVRSELKGVNLDANDNLVTNSEQLFSYKMVHHEDGRYFNGNISKISWKNNLSTSVRSYDFSYDRGNRLTNANFLGASGENYNVANTYDVNGNLQTLQRYSKTGASSWGLVDNLSYSYMNNGNRLQKVDDAISGNIQANDFRDVSGNDYTFSIDGKITSDANKGISLIEYNYLHLTRKVTFASGKTVEYWYTSTGERRQRKVTNGGTESYTLYDGEMVYTYTGANPTVNNFTVAEIKTPEGRLVNNNFEYSYTDQVGNLRLSYRDSLGIAVITQKQDYDPWSNVLAGTEYSSNVNAKDKYLVSGKESDSETGNILLDWRDYDSTTGRMNSFDPADQSMSISGYAYCGNNPVSMIDPDGREFTLLALLGTALFSGHVAGTLSVGSGGSYGKGFLNGFATGIIGGGVASQLSIATNALGTVGSGFVTGASSGFVTGGIGAALNGESFWDGAFRGGLFGGAVGAISGFLFRGKPHYEMNEEGELKNLAGWDINETASDASKFNDQYFKNLSKEFKVDISIANEKNLPSSDVFWDASKKSMYLLNSNGTPSYINGLEQPSLFGRSTIWLSPSRFADERLLFKTLGHELIHAWHDNMTSFFRRSGEYTNISEASAHNWSYVMGSKLGAVERSAQLFQNYYSGLSQSAKSLYASKYLWIYHKGFGRYLLQNH